MEVAMDEVQVRALVNHVERFVDRIVWAWNTRDAAALSDMYLDEANIVHKQGAAHGREDIDLLYRVICRNGERMGYMHVSQVVPESISSIEGGYGYIVGISVFCHFLNPEWTGVINTKTKLVLAVTDKETRIVKDVEQVL